MFRRLCKAIKRIFKKKNPRWERLKKAKRGLTKHERRQISRFYSKCPKGYEVDHIKPIAKGGLHRINNLQYLTRKENRRKGATYSFWRWIFSCQ